MAKKHKHEEHVNLERWVISYADMITLLFALFVVLYALGLDKMKNEVAQSIRWALHIEGEGRTQEQGIFQSGNTGGGVLIDAPPLMNVQKGAMKEFLRQALPDEFSEITGSSLEVVVNDDTISFKGPLSAYFIKGRKELRKEVQPWLGKLVQNSHEFAANIRILIEAPQSTIGKKDNGTSRKSIDLCHERLVFLNSLVGVMNGVEPTQIRTEFNYKYFANLAGGAKDWEDTATITFAFSNQFPAADGGNFKENPLGK